MWSILDHELTRTAIRREQVGELLSQVLAGKIAMAVRSGGRKSVPQIFIDGVYVGGAEDPKALDATGKLDRLLGRGP